jgi:hypothetical protein
VEDNPHEILIGKYPKFPLYIDVIVRQVPTCIKDVLTPSNLNGLKVLGDAVRNLMMCQIFPFRLRIQLVPELNVLTIEFENQT